MKDEMVGWHHRPSEHEFEPTPGDSEGQGSLACCHLWGLKESDMTEQHHSHRSYTHILRSQPIFLWSLSWAEGFCPVTLHGQLLGTS